jgi:hypothetical protein
MTEAVFTFSSTHGAVTGERRLLEGGVAVKVMPLPSSLGAGCGLALRVPGDELERARRLLADAGLAPEGLYARAVKNGKTEYLPMNEDM